MQGIAIIIFLNFYPKNILFKIQLKMGIGIMLISGFAIKSQFILTFDKVNKQ